MTFIFKGFSALSTFSLLIFANTFLLNQPALAKGQITDVYRHKSRNSQYSIVDAAKKDQSSIRIAAACSGNGNIAASAYNLGVLLGLAAFQRSVNQPGLASDAFGMAQDEARYLQAHGIPVQNTVDYDAANDVERGRAMVERVIRNINGNYANVYRLGLLIGLAEGQTTSPSFSEGTDLAHSSLSRANTLINGDLSFISFNAGTMNEALRLTENSTHGREDTHSGVYDLRREYEDTVSTSCDY